MPKRKLTDALAAEIAKKAKIRVGSKAYRKRNARTEGYVGIENKFIDYTYSGAIVATNTSAMADPTTISCLNGIDTGDGESNRDGRKVNLRSVHLRGAVVLPNQNDLSSTAEPGATVRIALVLDRQANGVTMTSDTCFLAATNVEHAYRNLQYSKRYKILMDKTIQVSPTGGGVNPSAEGTVDAIGNTVPFKFNKKLNIPVTYNGTGNTIAAIVDNALHVVAFASKTGATLNYQSRVRFSG